MTLHVSPCFGPLVETDIGESSCVFSPLGENYLSENKLCQTLLRRTIAEQIGASAILQKHCSSSGSACEILHSKPLTPLLPPLLSLLGKSETTVLSLESTLHERDENRLKTYFKLAYLLRGPMNPPCDDDTTNVAAASIQVSKLAEGNSDNATDFFLELFESKFSGQLEQSESAVLRSKLREFLAASNASHIYTRNGKIVGLLGLWKNMKHPHFESEVNHIGAIGLERSVLSSADANSIKNHWKSLVFQPTASASTRVSARVDTFNLGSLRLLDSWGLKIVGLELDQK